MKKYILIYTILLGLLVFNLGCYGTNRIYLEGKVKMKGNEPHSYLVIEDKKTKKDYKIQNYQEFKLQKKQNKEIKLQARILTKAIGPGFPTVVKVIKIDDY